MYSMAELKNEIGAKIEWLRENNGPELHPNWIAKAIMDDHSDIQGTDADFHLCCSYAIVRKEVTQQINQTETDPKVTQLALDGFAHLQHYYVIERSGERLAVRVDNLTDTELDGKAGEYDSMGRTCLEHADEIRRYKELRRDKKMELHFQRPATAELRA